MSKYIIYNAQIVNNNNIFTGYVVIDGEIIQSVEVGTPAPSLLSEIPHHVNAEGNLLIPGVIDDQVHFREPGLTAKADIESESRAAVAGGVTSFMDMPNTIPQTTTIEALEAKNQIAEEKSIANYSFYIGATNNNIDELKKVDFNHTCGVKLFLGASTGNMLVNNQKALQEIFSEIPALIAIHSEDEEVIRRNKERYSLRHGDNLPIYFHPMIRNAEACYTSTARAIEMAEKCGTRLHVLHLSTERETELFSDAPLSEKKITAEVCVHHLWFTDNDYARLGNRIKWNPAIKSTADRNALREAINNNKIDVIATDHAPHLLSEKVGNVLTATSGAPIIQFSLLLMLEMWHKGIFSLEKIVEKMCHAPADLYNIEKRGYIRPGYYADLVLIDTKATNLISASDILSKCGWSPLEGEILHSKVLKTFVNGNLVYDNGTFNPNKGKRLSFNRTQYLI